MFSVREILIYMHLAINTLVRVTCYELFMCLSPFLFKYEKKKIYIYIYITNKY